MFPPWHFRPVGWLGTLQIGIKAERCFHCGVVGRVATNWYQSQGFNTDPGWAMLVVNETNILE
jgi:hypothetical protein